MRLGLVWSVPLAIAVLSVAVWLVSSVSVSADARSEYLVRLLKGSSQFRVRAQAAVSLASARDEPGVVQALSVALNDDHAAVRAAAASALEKLGDPSALAALEARRNDREKPVRSAVERAIIALRRAAAKRSGRTAIAPPTRRVPTGPPKYYVGIGTPGTKANLDPETLRRARDFLESRLREVDGVVIAPANEKPRAARSVLQEKKLAGYYLDSSVVSVEKRPGGDVRAVVSVIVGSYPGREMRMILQGAATVMGGDSSTQMQAIEGAFRGALRNLPKVFETVQR